MITTRTSATVWGTALLLCGASPWAFAQLDENALDAAPNSDSPPEMQQQSAQPQGADKIYGSVGVDYASHFVSYGGDVWGGGNDFYGSQSTTFAYIDLGADLPNGFALTFGAWSDINNNTDEQTIGGNIQEIDVYGGLTYTTGAVTLRPRCGWRLAGASPGPVRRGGSGTLLRRGAYSTWFGFGGFGLGVRVGVGVGVRVTLAVT